MYRDKQPFFKNFHPLKMLFFAGIAALFAFVMGGVVMLLWNAILPEVTGVKRINYWQALGMLVLFRILFGRFRPGPGHRRHRGRGRRHKWKEKWMNMDPEEKVRFKEKWKDYCDRNKGK